MAFADLTANLNLNIANFSSRLSQASRQMGNFARNMQQSYGEAANALNKHNLQLKDTVRIVHGIVIAQTFYQAAGAITDATRSLWDFNVALDYMNVTYSALFGNAKVASDFMSVLQEHSVETIFDYQNLADASKKLLAYGIEYENLMFIMEGLTNLGAMSGDPAALDRIALALGQIYTKGKLSAEEMRQLANAYIPITEILQEKFGLTGDDLKRVGDLNLPASDVINAIVDYANENFGSVGDAAMYTITGLQNRIVDTLKVVGSQMLKPITTAYKSFLAYISKGLETLRSEFETGGVGGIFEYLVPDPNTQQVIRQFIANVKNLFMSLVSVGTVASQIFGNFASVLITTFNILSPVVLGFVNVLAGLMNALLNTRAGAAALRVALIAAAGAFVILKVQALSALVIDAVTKAVANLSKALRLLASIITKHPILALFAALAITLVGVSTASNSANKSISSLFDTLSGAAGGNSSNDVLQKAEQDILDGADAADQFNKRLEGATDSAENLGDAASGAGDAAKKAAKKVSGLLSFDEVFKLPEPTESASSSTSGSGLGSGILDDIGSLMDGLGGLGDALIPDIPDFSEYISDFTDGLFGGLQDSVVDKLKSIGLGALIGGGLGAIIGGILGGPSGAVLGAKIGAFAGGVVGWIWEKLEGAMSNTVAGALSGIAAIIGKSFGTTFGSVLKTFINTGSFAGFFKSIGEIFTATGLKSIAKGGLIGAAIGLIVDGIAHLLWGTLEEKFENANAETAKVGQTIGSVIGAVVGGLLGGPPGVIIGSAIGTFAGGFVGLFWKPIKEYFDPKNNALTAFFVEVGKDIAVWATDTIKSLSNWWTETSTGFATWWDETRTGFSEWWDDTTTGLADWFDKTVATFSDWDSINADTLGQWWSETKTGFTSWFSETKDKFNAWDVDTTNKLIAWNTKTSNGFREWADKTLSGLTSWARDGLATILQWLENTRDKFIDWQAKVTAKFEEWDEKVSSIIAGFVKAAWLSIDRGMTDLYTTTVNKLADVKKQWSDKFNEIRTNFSNWWTDLGRSMSSWLYNNVTYPVTNTFSSLLSSISRIFSDIWSNISSWWSSIRNIFSGGISFGINGSVSAGSGYGGHADGGVFDREHLARFAEGNKREAIIPLENDTAMQPFVDAVSNGIVGSLAPIVAQINSGNSNSLPPLYVGTLIADDRGLKQLYKKFELIQLQENDRRGLSPV